MKKTLFLFLISSGISNAMEDKQNRFEFWSQLPQELKVHVLSFVATPGSYTKLKDLLININREISGHVRSQALFPLFINACAENLVTTDVEKAKQVLLKAVADNNHAVAMGFARALIKLNSVEAAQLVENYFTVEKIDRAVPLIKLLLESGFNPDQQIRFSKYSDTILVTAVSLNHLGLAQILLQHGANTNVAVRCTPLETAIYNYGMLEEPEMEKLLCRSDSRTDMIKLLLEFNADPLLEGFTRRNPIDLAQLLGLHEVVNLFQDVLAKKNNS